MGFFFDQIEVKSRDSFANATSEEESETSGQIRICQANNVNGKVMSKVSDSSIPFILFA
ncbi:hypothetical protein MLD52_14550 [Puniceicoccaceae bacterium K14]|nr:hypothetical protein [Puniceicoccaceae bacterium K14]